MHDVTHRRANVKLTMRLHQTRRRHVAAAVLFQSVLQRIQTPPEAFQKHLACQTLLTCPDLVIFQVNVLLNILLPLPLKIGKDATNREP